MRCKETTAILSYRIFILRLCRPMEDEMSYFICSESAPIVVKHEFVFSKLNGCN